MIKIQYVLFPLLIMILVTPFVSLSYSQNVTNQNTTSTTMINGSKKNDSSVTVINAVGDIEAHNHIMAESGNGRWFISGAGGRSHYDGETSPEWPYVNNKNYGYLQIRINNTDGNVLGTNFYGLYGRLLH